MLSYSEKIVETIDLFRSNDPIYQQLSCLFHKEQNIQIKNNYLMAMEYKENIYRQYALDILKKSENQDYLNLTKNFIHQYHKSIVATIISLIISNSFYEVPNALISIVRLVTQGITLTIVSTIYVPIITLQSTINTALSYIPLSKPIEFAFNPQNVTKSVGESVDLIAWEISKQGGDTLANSFYYIVFVIVLIIVYSTLICLEKLQEFRSATVSIGYINLQFEKPVSVQPHPEPQPTQPTQTSNNLQIQNHLPLPPPLPLPLLHENSDIVQPYNM